MYVCVCVYVCVCECVCVCVCADTYVASQSHSHTVCVFFLYIHITDLTERVRACVSTVAGWSSQDGRVWSWIRYVLYYILSPLPLLAVIGVSVAFCGSGPFVVRSLSKWSKAQSSGDFFGKGH